MSSFIQKIFGKDQKFFDLLETSAHEARNSANLLARLHLELGKPTFEATLAELSSSRRRHKRVALSITQALCETFVTPLEREDIEQLSNALYSVPKTTEKIGERLAICPSRFTTDVVGKQIHMLVEATQVVCEMVEGLRKSLSGAAVQDAYERLQTIEGDADKLMVGLLKELFHGDVDAKEVIVLKDIYEMLERDIDCCRDAGKVVFQVALKYS